MSARSNAVLWFGVFAAPLAWAGHLVVGYYFEGIACSDGSRTGWSGEHWWLVGVTVVALAIGALGALSALDPRGRVFFLAALAVASSLFFLAIIALAGAYVIILDPCTPG